MNTNRYAILAKSPTSKQWLVMRSNVSIFALLSIVTKAAAKYHAATGKPLQMKAVALF